MSACIGAGHPARWVVRVAEGLEKRNSQLGSVDDMIGASAARRGRFRAGGWVFQASSGGRKWPHHLS